MSIVLIHSEKDALTISWPGVPRAKRYVLQYCRNDTNNNNDGSAGKPNFQLLSDKLTATQARKKNLADDKQTGFWFRVGAVMKESDPTITDWVSHCEPFHLLTQEQDDKRMDAPRVQLGGTNRSAHVAWNAAATKAESYELQMRENVGGRGWTTIAPSFSGTEVRKKRLTSDEGYQFRVRPAGDKEVAFSPPSVVVKPLGLSSGMQRLFGTLENNTLLKGSQELSLEDALGGKEFVLLYASAHWCGPCRQFTPQLTQWYQSLPANSPVEIVFLSADHDERGFRQYYQSMPWLAVDFDDDTREQLMAHIRVTGIPRLAVLDGRTGRVIEDNAVGKPFDVNRWRGLAR